MNFIYNDTGSLQKFFEIFCHKALNNKAFIKEQYGTGYIQTYNIKDGPNIYIFDFTLNQPLLIRWELKGNEASRFYLFQNISRESKESNTEETIVEEGTVLFTDNNNRRRLWLPGIKYKVLSINFTFNWYATINRAIEFPNQIQQYISHTNKLYLHLPPSSYASLIYSQIIEHVNKADRTDTFLSIKCLEIVLLLFNKALKNVNETKNKSSIHPADLADLNNFMGNMHNQLDKIPDLNEASLLLGMSQSKFQRLFKALMGTSYYKYVLKFKMDAAMEMLINKTPVSQVAYNIGYSSIGNFTSAFKNCYKILPSDILKQTS